MKLDKAKRIVVTSSKVIMKTYLRKLHESLINIPSNQVDEGAKNPLEDKH